MSILLTACPSPLTHWTLRKYRIYYLLKIIMFMMKIEFNKYNPVSTGRSMSMSMASDTGGEYVSERHQQQQQQMNDRKDSDVDSGDGKKIYPLRNPDSPTYKAERK